MFKYIVVMAALNACVFAMEAEARSPNHSDLTIHQIYGGDNGTPVRIYSMPMEANIPPSTNIYYDNRSSSVPSTQPLDSLPSTYRNRYLMERTLEQLNYYDSYFGDED